MQNNSKKIKNKGFTLIEALVAITILTVSIVGPITIASKSISSAMFARDQITAFYLAQEAVEFIRNKRDGNKIEGDDWLAIPGLNTCSNGSPCRIDVTVAVGSEINNCPSADCPPLQYDSGTGLYNYSGSVDSIFTRNVEIIEVEDDEVSIIVTMSWRTGIMQKTFVVKEHIFDW